MKLIEVKNLSKIYGFGNATTVAVDNVTLSIKEGEFVAIMGPSGSGKSTLMHVIGLLDTPSHGEIMLEGKDMSEVSAKQRALLRRKKIGFVFQSFNLLSRLTAIENVALPLSYHGLSHVKKLHRAEKILKAVGLEDRQYYMPNQLSGGQVQRVAIARALINKPALILADEPTGNLDSASGHSVMELLQELHKQGNTVVVVTHDPSVASYAKRIIHMLDGRIETDSLGLDAPKTTAKAEEALKAGEKPAETKRQRRTRRKKAKAGAKK